MLTQGFTVDDQDGIREPVGMLGSRLGVSVHLVTGAATAVQNVVRSVNRAGLTVEDVVLQPLASGESVLTPDERELGVLLIDIGGGTADVALFRDGAVWHTAVIPLGGDHITNDIAVGLRTPPPSAEELKKLFGCAQASLVLEDETVEVPSIGGRKPRVLSRQTLARIVQARVEEILTLVARGVNQAGLDDAATAGAVVTGGGTIMEGVPELAETILDLPVRRGIPKWVGGLYEQVESPVFATAVGLVLTGARRDRPADTSAPGARIRRGLARHGPDGAPCPRMVPGDLLMGRRRVGGDKQSSPAGAERRPKRGEGTMREELIFRLEEEDRELAAKIRVVGLGGGGSNAVNRMISSRFTGVTFSWRTPMRRRSAPRRPRSRSSSAGSSPAGSGPARTRRSAGAPRTRTGRCSTRR